VTLRIVVADDQGLSRDRLLRLLEAERDVEVVATCADGSAALEAIHTCAPDVAFLDVRMPGLDGMGVVEALRGQPLPVVVLVTAHEGYAVRAFELDAADYLLKPFSPIRLRTALIRARERLAARSASRFERALEMLKARDEPPTPAPDRVAVRTDGRTFFLKTESTGSRSNERSP